LKTFGEYIEAKRAACKKSVAEISKEVGVSKQSYFYWRDNTRVPNAIAFFKLTVALGMTDPERSELLELISRESPKVIGRSNVKIK
jgi:transposase-like protein